MSWPSFLNFHTRKKISNVKEENSLCRSHFFIIFSQILIIFFLLKENFSPAKFFRRYAPCFLSDLSRERTKYEIKFVASNFLSEKNQNFLLILIFFFEILRKFLIFFISRNFLAKSEIFSAKFECFNGMF